MGQNWKLNFVLRFFYSLLFVLYCRKKNLENFFSTNQYKSHTKDYICFFLFLFLGEGELGKCALKTVPTTF